MGRDSTQAMCCAANPRGPRLHQPCRHPWTTNQAIPYAQTSSGRRSLTFSEIPSQTQVRSPVTQGTSGPNFLPLGICVGLSFSSGVKNGIALPFTLSTALFFLGDESMNSLNSETIPSSLAVIHPSIHPPALLLMAVKFRPLLSW